MILRAVTLAFAALVLAPPPPAAAGELKPLARIAIGDGVLHEAFAFADGGGQFAYAETDGKGKTLVHIGPAGGKGRGTTVDITSFSAAPERILFVGGHWFVISNEGTRRAAVIGPSGRIENQIGAFGEGFVSEAHGKTFVTVTDKGERAGGHAYAISAYRPTGALLGGKTITIAGDGTIAGSDGLVFVAFTGGYLQALVKKPGRYDARRDARGGTEIAVLDVLSGKTGPGRNLPDITKFLRFVEKRAEKPGLEAFVRADDEARGPGAGRPGREAAGAGAAGEVRALRGAVAAAAGVGWPPLLLADRRPAEPGAARGAEEGGARAPCLRGRGGERQGDAARSGAARRDAELLLGGGRRQGAVLKRSQQSGGTEIQIFGR